MRKMTLVKPNDPQKPYFRLFMKGEVQNIADISSRVLLLEGTAGDKLETVLKITPFEEYKFSILGIKKKADAKFKAVLTPPDGDGKTWLIKVTAESLKKGRWDDILTIRTDSKYMPEMKIKVEMRISEKKKSQKTS